MENNLEFVCKYQKTLLNSCGAQLLTIRQVTPDNRGKRTAGTDGVKSLMHNQRLDLLKTLYLNGKADLIVRIYMPKSYSAEMPTLGIPTIRDTAKQALALMPLEPQWEAKFESKSYGFPIFHSIRLL